MAMRKRTSKLLAAGLAGVLAAATLLPGAKQQLGAKVTINGHPVDDQSAESSLYSRDSVFSHSVNEQMG